MRCGFIGAEGHSFRNVYPARQYAPADLVAVCAVDEDWAATYEQTVPQTSGPNQRWSVRSTLQLGIA